MFKIHLQGNFLEFLDHKCFFCKGIFFDILDYFNPSPKCPTLLYSDRFEGAFSFLNDLKILYLLYL